MTRVGHAAILVLLSTALAPADAVQTAAQRFEGASRVDARALTIDSHRVAWTDVLYASLNSDSTTLPQPEAVWLGGGQKLIGRIIAVTSRDVTVRHPLLGERTLPRSAVVAIDFAPELTPPAIRGEATLERTRGEPLPGELLWLDRDKLGIDSLLGAIELPRSGARRYRFGLAADPGSPGDTLRLLDGSVLRGTISVEDDGFVLEHPVLGQLSVAAPAIRAVIFRSRAWFIGSSPPTQVRTTPLITAAPDESAAFAIEHDPATGMGRHRILPGVTATFAVPASLTSGATIRVAIGPASGNRGRALVRLLAGGEPILHHVVEPTDEPTWFTATLPPGTDQLQIAADFATPLQLPATVLLIEPHASPAPGPGS